MGAGGALWVVLEEHPAIRLGVYNDSHIFGRPNLYRPETMRHTRLTPTPLKTLVFSLLVVWVITCRIANALQVPLM